MHPNSFQVNEAWIVFQLSEQAIHTEQDGDFFVFALMDAASCFILSSTMAPAKDGALSKLDARCLLKEGNAHHRKWPKTLYVPSAYLGTPLVAEAERLGIPILSVEEVDLLPFIGEARQVFNERFG